MKRKNKILIWSHDLNKITGQNIITKKVKDFFQIHIKDCFLYDNENLINHISSILNAFKLILKSLINQKVIVYLVAQSSFKGFLRDLPVLFLGVFGKKIIVHIHGSQFPDMFKWRFFSLLVRFLYSKCHIIIPSEHIIKRLDTKIFKSINLIENFTSLEKKQRNINKNHKFTILWNSNIQASKGFIETLEAFKKFSEKSANTQFIITGAFISDYERSKNYMKVYLEKNLHNKNIKYLGLVSREKMNDLLTTSDMVILPSTYKTECQPLALIEAMIFGINIITTNTDAIRTTIGEYPAIFANRSVNDLEHRLINSYNTKENSNLISSYDVLKAKKRFSEENFFLKLKKMFEVS